MEIIKLHRNDIRAALELAWTVFLEFDAPDYSAKGIEEFKKFTSFHSVLERFDKGEMLFWGCIEEGELIGTIATNNVNHICLLFVKKEYHRRGAARKLLQQVIESCMGNLQIREITVKSSPFAVEVYRRLGFVERDQEQTVNGMRFTPMALKLRQ
ncbi:GNAT family N-acetyltransferase [Mesobacillus foraminis]|uniref:GNAT family N-acetyltransferase n=1 Tax=Mesobacillus foraminis TaxID=279826 RepID=UPI0039A0EF1C